MLLPELQRVVRSWDFLSGITGLVRYLCDLGGRNRLRGQHEGLAARSSWLCWRLLWRG